MSGWSGPLWERLSPPIPRTSENPCADRIAQTSLPDSTRSLANRHLNVRHIDFIMQPPFDFVSRCSLVEEF